MMIKSIVLSSFLFFAFVQSFAQDPKVIGKILTIYGDQTVRGDHGDQEFANSLKEIPEEVTKKPEDLQDANPTQYKVLPGDRFFAVAGQTIIFHLEDDTELVLGPSSLLYFSSWNWVNPETKLRERVVSLIQGSLRVTVKKTYSQKEPFFVTTPYGALAVRGTEFVVEAGEGGHLLLARYHTKKEVRISRKEMDVHVLSGEVAFSKTRKGVHLENERVRVLPGQTALIQEKMAMPTLPHPFDLVAFQKYIETAFPGVKLAVDQSQTNFLRAQKEGYFEGFFPKERNIASPAEKK